LSCSAVSLLLLTTQNCCVFVAYLKHVNLSGQVIRITPNLNGPVAGIAVLNNQLYVSHSGRHRIAVYSPATFQFQQYLYYYCSLCGEESQDIVCDNCGGNDVDCPGLRVEEYGWVWSGEYCSVPQCTVACAINNCLYVAIHDMAMYSAVTHNMYYRSRIYKVAFDQNNMLSAWHVQGHPVGRSVNYQFIQPPPCHEQCPCFA